MSLLHNHYSLTGQEAHDLLADMFGSNPPSDQQHSKPRRTTPANSHKLIRSYDHSAPTSPIHSPVMSRRNSTSSINSTQSEPYWESDRGRQSSNASTKTNDSSKSLKSFFKKKPKDPNEKKKNDKIILTSSHAAAVKTKMMMDPNYRDHMNSHKSSQAKTANVQGTHQSSHLTAAEQEMRHPHSGPPIIHSALDMPALTRIQSGDEEDPEIDRFERIRREWSGDKHSGMARVDEGPDSTSRGNSPITSGYSTPHTRSPAMSRETSPNRGVDGLTVPRPIMPKTKNSWGAGYKRNEKGVWTKRDSGSTTPNHRPNHGPHGNYNDRPDPVALERRLREQLHMRG